MEYTAESLIPVMAHIAKNVVKVTEGQTKHLVGAHEAGLGCIGHDCPGFSPKLSSLAGRQRQVLHLKAHEDRHHPAAQVAGVERLGKASCPVRTSTWHHVLICTFVI